MGYLLDIDNDGVYVAECERGHAIRVVHDSLPYSLLYESAAMAMLSGFHLQAVSAAATALERFFEFSIRVLLIHLTIEESQIDKAWKPLSINSDRQYSGFMMLYLTAFKQAYPLEQQKMIELRNNVVHKGKIPSREEAEKYLKYVYSTIRQIHGELQTLCNDAVESVNNRNRILRSKKLNDLSPTLPDKDGIYWSAGIQSDFGMLSDIFTNRPKDFESRLEIAKQAMDLWGLCPAAERQETSLPGTALITEYSHQPKYTLEVQVHDEQILVPLSEAERIEIGKLRTREERAARIQQIVQTFREKQALNDAEPDKRK